MSPRDPQQAERRHVPPTVARQSSLRDQNLSVVTRTLFASGGATSRAGLAERTGLTRATVSRLCQELLDAGILAEQRPAENVRPGRPGTPLAPASRTLAGVGIEVNIDYMAGRALDLAGNVLAEFKKPGTYADSDPAAVLPELGDLAVGLVEQVRATGARIVGTTLALPGLVESTTNTLLLAPNLNWRMVEPVPLLGPRFAALGVEVTIANDAKLQGLAAATLSPGRLAPDSTFLYVSGDIGIGSAIIVEGQIEGGRHGWAGELGHISIEPAGPPCRCGSRGCLERYAGKYAVLEAADLPLDSPPGELLRRLEAGDERAHRAVHRAGWALGIGISDAINLIDIGHVVLGTGLAPLVPWLLPAILRERDLRVLAARFLDIEITGAAPDSSPASTGGALRALDPVVSDPAEWIPEPAPRP